MTATSSNIDKPIFSELKVSSITDLHSYDMFLSQWSNILAEFDLGFTQLLITFPIEYYLKSYKSSYNNFMKGKNYRYF